MSAAQQKLAKAVRSYRALLGKLPKVSGSEPLAVRAEAAEYLRSLYQEFGREAVRRALGSQP